MVVIHFWVQPVPKVGHLEILMNLIKTTIIDKKKGVLLFDHHEKVFCWDAKESQYRV